MSTYTVTVQELPDGDLVLPLSDEIMDKLGWNIGDTLIWTDNHDGSWGIHKQESTDEAQKISSVLVDASKLGTQGQK